MPRSVRSKTHARRAVIRGAMRAYSGPCPAAAMKEPGSKPELAASPRAVFVSRTARRSCRQSDAGRSSGGNRTKERIRSPNRRPAGDPVLPVGGIQPLKQRAGVALLQVDGVAWATGTKHLVLVDCDRAKGPSVSAHDSHDTKVERLDPSLLGALVLFGSAPSIPYVGRLRHGRPGGRGSPPQEGE